MNIYRRKKQAGKNLLPTCFCVWMRSMFFMSHPIMEAGWLAKSYQTLDKDTLVALEHFKKGLVRAAVLAYL